MSIEKQIEAMLEANAKPAATAEPVVEATVVEGTASAAQAATAEPVVEIHEEIVELGNVSHDIKVDVSEEVNALFTGETLSEEFKDKATTIFEAAVVARVKTEIENLQEKFDARLEVEVAEIKEGLSEKIDGYLVHVCEKWMQDNEIALESGIKTSIAENFIDGMKKLFAESYVEMPEEKLDLYEEVVAKVDVLEAKLTENVSENIALKKQIKEMKKQEAVASLSEGLTDVQAEKFAALVEEISSQDEETMMKKMKTIRESFFQADASKAAPVFTQSTVIEGTIESSTAIVEEEVTKPKVVGAMSMYLDTISRQD